MRCQTLNTVRQVQVGQLAGTLSDLQCTVHNELAERRHQYLFAVLQC